MSLRLITISIILCYGLSFSQLVVRNQTGTDVLKVDSNGKLTTESLQLRANNPLLGQVLFLGDNDGNVIWSDQPQNGHYLKWDGTQSNWVTQEPPLGPTGPTGPQGIPGTIGPEGPTGPQGPAGAVGPTGPAGPRGTQGPTGAVGATGPRGTRGPSGAVGPTGPRGTRGPSGAVGPTGPRGTRGTRGTRGPAGPRGTRGTRGPTGPTGPSAHYWSGSPVNTSTFAYRSGDVSVGTSTHGSKLYVQGQRSSNLGYGSVITSLHARHSSALASNATHIGIEGQSQYTTSAYNPDRTAVHGTLISGSNWYAAGALSALEGSLNRVIAVHGVINSSTAPANSYAGYFEGAQTYIWQMASSGGDYAEWLEKEESTSPGDLIGLDLSTGLARKYRMGDEFIGVHSSDPAVIGNQIDRDMKDTHVLVALVGQVKVDESQVEINGRLVKTRDGKKIGLLLKNGRVLLNK